MKALPYPILDVTDLSRADYKSGDYQVDIKDFVPNEAGIIEIEFTHQSSIEEINALIEEGKASFCILVLCSSTLVRKVFKSNSHKHKIEIRLNDFCGKVEFIPQIVVEDKVDYFFSDSLNAEYDGTTFDLYPGDVLAVAESEYRYFKFDSLKFESLISLRTDKELDPEAYSVVLDDSKVYIDMGVNLRDLWAELKSDPGNRPLLAMSVYKDCFMIAIEELARVPESSEKRWAKSLNMKLEELGIELNSEIPLNEINKFAQKLLESDSVKELVKLHLGNR